MTLQGRVAVVTAGGGYGIGRAACKRLAAQGALVAVTDRSGRRAAAVAEAIRAQGHHAEAFELDVTRSAEVDAVFDDIARKLGPVAILVNNAGVSIPSPVAEMSDELFDTVVNVSLRGTFYCSRKALKPMLAAGFGRIVNVSSYVAFAGSPDLAHYGAAKAAIVGFTRSLALEVGGSGVTVNAVAPGIILNQHLEANREQFSAEIRERLDKGTPVGRNGRPQDVADAILYLVSPQAAFVTGATLPVTGGLFML